MRRIDEKGKFPILIGSAHDVADIKLLKKNNIKVVLNVCNDIDSFYHDDIVYIKWGLDDPATGLAPRNDVFHAAMLLAYGVDCALRLDGNILVHCAAGHNRSSLVVAEYLVIRYGWPLERAVKAAKVKDKKPWMIDKGYVW